MSRPNENCLGRRGHRSLVDAEGHHVARSLGETKSVQKKGEAVRRLQVPRQGNAVRTAIPRSALTVKCTHFGTECTLSERLICRVAHPAQTPAWKAGQRPAAVWSGQPKECALHRPTPGTQSENSLEHSSRRRERVVFMEDSGPQASNHDSPNEHLNPVHRWPATAGPGTLVPLRWAQLESVDRSIRPDLS